MPVRSVPTPALPCPHCGSGSVQRHGSFPLKNGSRQRRFRCRTCGRTYHPYTATPLNYVKKRDRWEQFAQGMVQGLSLRQIAAALQIHVATAFRWRHRLLAALCHQPQPVLTGPVAACNVFVRYSEKGNRHTDGPGAHGIRLAPVTPDRWIDRGRVGRYGKPGRRPFRRFIDGKSSCVLLASGGEQPAVAVVSRGRPAPEHLQSALAQVVGDGAELWAQETALFAEACRRLGLRHRETWEQAHDHPCREADRLRSQFCAWLRRFHGVATRYLAGYLAWYHCAGWVARDRPAEALSKLLAEGSARVPTGQVA